LCMLHVSWCMLHVAWCMLHVACCMLHVACCVMCVACCMLHVAPLHRCMLHVAPLHVSVVHRAAACMPVGCAQGARRRAAHVRERRRILRRVCGTHAPDDRPSADGRGRLCVCAFVRFRLAASCVRLFVGSSHWVLVLVAFCELVPLFACLFVCFRLFACCVCLFVCLSASHVALPFALCAAAWRAARPRPLALRRRLLVPTAPLFALIPARPRSPTPPLPLVSVPTATGALSCRDQTRARRALGAVAAKAEPAPGCDAHKRAGCGGCAQSGSVRPRWWAQVLGRVARGRGRRRGRVRGGGGALARFLVYAVRGPRCVRCVLLSPCCVPRATCCVLQRQRRVSHIIRGLPFEWLHRSRSARACVNRPVGPSPRPPWTGRTPPSSRARERTTGSGARGGGAAWASQRPPTTRGTALAATAHSGRAAVNGRSGYIYIYIYTYIYRCIHIYYV
jgi:hypothetical protein